MRGFMFCRLQACDDLVQLIKDHNLWVEPPPLEAQLVEA